MNDIRDIKGPVPLPSGLFGPFLVLTGLVTGLGGLVLWRRRRLARLGDGIPEAVRAGLETLATARTLDDRTYYFRLAALARLALGRRLGIAVTAMTTTEIVPRLAVLPEEERLALVALFTRADAACYAGQDIPAGERLVDAATVGRMAGRRG